jgi:DNA-binding CsgD family transcriptional regulator
VVRAEDIYEGLFCEAAFAQLPVIMAKAANASTSIVQWRRRGGVFEVSAYAGFSDEAVRNYDERWRSNDLWAAAALSPSRVNRYSLLEEAVPEVELARSAFYNDFLKPEADDAFHCMGAGFSTPAGDGLFGLTRKRGDPAFEAQDLERFRPYALMANRVLKLRGELAMAHQSSALARTSLDALALAIVTVDQHGRLVSQNEAAKTVIRRGDGLTARAGVIGARKQSDLSELHQAIGLATARTTPAGGAVQVSRGPEQTPYLVTVSPVVVHGGRRRALLVFSDPDADDPSLAQRLREFFGLTPAEAAIAVELGKGRSLDQISSSRRVQWTTLRSQLRAIMAKMGCVRQAEVAALVARLPSVQAV